MTHRVTCWHLCKVLHIVTFRKPKLQGMYEYRTPCGQTGTGCRSKDPSHAVALLLTAMGTGKEAHSCFEQCGGYTPPPCQACNKNRAEQAQETIRATHAHHPPCPRPPLSTSPYLLSPAIQPTTCSNPNTHPCPPTSSSLRPQNPAPHLISPGIMSLAP